jgi:hypothetical protein
MEGRASDHVGAVVYQISRWRYGEHWLILAIPVRLAGSATLPNQVIRIARSKNGHKFHPPAPEHESGARPGADALLHPFDTC